MFAKVAAIAAVAGLVAAAPIEQRGAPAGWAYGYLEDYQTYHVRYLALDCQDKHNTSFFQDCCRPMLSTENLWDNRKAECRPSQDATDEVVASLAAKAAGPSPTGSAAAAEESEDCDDDVAWSSAASSVAATSSAAPTSAAAHTSSAAAAPAVAMSSSSTTYSAAATTSSAAKEYVAPVPSSSTTTTQAWTPAPTTQAPAPTTQAPSNNNGGNKFSGGYATYFYQGGNAGACGQVHGDNDMIAAIDHEQWGDQSFGSGSNTCGRWLTVCNTNNGKCVSVVVADVCPTCANGNSLDLSSGAFSAIANPSDGMVPITWSWN